MLKTSDSFSDNINYIIIDKMMEFEKNSSELIGVEHNVNTDCLDICCYPKGKPAYLIDTPCYIDEIDRTVLIPMLVARGYAFSGI